MQNRFLSTEFFIILLFFALPPIVFPQALPTERVIHFSWMTFILAAFAGVLLWQLKHTKTNNLNTTPVSGENEKRKTDVQKVRAFLHQGQCLFAFGSLLVFAGLFELTGRFLFHTDDLTHLLPPVTFLGWINAIFGTICAAFYEEVLYRVYLPDAIKQLLKKRNHTENNNDAPSQKIMLICEAAAVILFALAHRYAGWLSVANAMAAGIILRRCYYKTGALWTNLTAHVAYNTVMTTIMLMHH
ncbi:MAG: CPBP family intramembrane metalloprotease [Treponema sp.]|nr:CPBP family intramembrane metalloprotease [Treponema sp.]